MLDQGADTPPEGGTLVKIFLDISLMVGVPSAGCAI